MESIQSNYSVLLYLTTNFTNETVKMNGYVPFHTISILVDDRQCQASFTSVFFTSPTTTSIHWRAAWRYSQVFKRIKPGGHDKSLAKVGFTPHRAEDPDDVGGKDVWDEQKLERLNHFSKFHIQFWGCSRVETGRKHLKMPGDLQEIFTYLF